MMHTLILLLLHIMFNKQKCGCYPSVGSQYCDKALIYNYVNNSFFRDLLTFITLAMGVDPGATSINWNTQTATWTETGVWGKELITLQKEVSLWQESKTLSCIVEILVDSLITKTIYLH